MSRFLCRRVKLRSMRKKEPLPFLFNLRGFARPNRPPSLRPGRRLRLSAFDVKCHLKLVMLPSGKASPSPFLLCCFCLRFSANIWRSVTPSGPVHRRSNCELRDLASNLTYAAHKSRFSVETIQIRIYRQRQSAPVSALFTHAAFSQQRSRLKGAQNCVFSRILFWKNAAMLEEIGGRRACYEYKQGDYWRGRMVACFSGDCGRRSAHFLKNSAAFVLFIRCP